jgi:hypothetical protein
MAQVDVLFKTRHESPAGLCRSASSRSSLEIASERIALGTISLQASPV